MAAKLERLRLREQELYRERIVLNKKQLALKEI